MKSPYETLHSMYSGPPMAPHSAQTVRRNRADSANIPPARWDQQARDGAPVLNPSRQTRWSARAQRENSRLTALPLEPPRIAPVHRKPFGIVYRVPSGASEAERMRADSDPVEERRIEDTLYIPEACDSAFDPPPLRVGTPLENEAEIGRTYPKIDEIAIPPLPYGLDIPVEEDREMLAEYVEVDDKVFTPPYHSEKIPVPEEREAPPTPYGAIGHYDFHPFEDSSEKCEKEVEYEDIFPEDPDEATRRNPRSRGLLYFKKWWYLRKVNVSVRGDLLCGTPIFIRENTIRVVNDDYSYFIPLEHVDYIRTHDGLKAAVAHFERRHF